MSKSNSDHQLGTVKPSARRPRLRTCLLWIVVLLIVGELGLRLVLGLGHVVVYKADAACGYIVKPDQDVTRFFSRNQINAFSMRCAAVQTPKPSGEFRVMFVGDSVTYGTAHVDQSRIFTTRLNRELPSLLHRPVEVLNASAGGWAVGNEVGYLRSRGCFGADLVILVLNSEDMVQPFSDPGVDNLGFPSRNPVLALTDLWGSFVRYRNSRGGVVDPGATAVSAGAQSDLAKCAHTLQLLDEARLLSSKAHAELAVLHSPVMEYDGTIQPFIMPWIEALRTWADHNGVSLLDLTSIYTTSGVPMAQIYLDHVHLRPKGHELVTAAVKKWSVVTAFDQAKSASK